MLDSRVHPEHIPRDGMRSTLFRICWCRFERAQPDGMCENTKTVWTRWTSFREMYAQAKFSLCSRQSSASSHRRRRRRRRHRHHHAEGMEEHEHQFSNLYFRTLDLSNGSNFVLKRFSVTRVFCWVEIQTLFGRFNAVLTRLGLANFRACCLCGIFRANAMFCCTLSS